MHVASKFLFIALVALFSVSVSADRLQFAVSMDYAPLEIPIPPPPPEYQVASQWLFDLELPTTDWGPVGTGPDHCFRAILFDQSDETNSIVTEIAGFPGGSYFFDWDVPSNFSNLVLRVIYQELTTGGSVTTTLALDFRAQGASYPFFTGIPAGANPPGIYGSIAFLVLESDGAGSPDNCQTLPDLAQWIKSAHAVEDSHNPRLFWDYSYFGRVTHADYKGANVSLEILSNVASCDGFRSPMANYPVKAKKNGVFPLKMELFDNEGYELMGGEVTAPPVVQVLFTAEGGGSAIDVSDDALSAGQGSDGNEFVFTDDGIWQFNLKSKNYSAAGTYMVTAVSGDESEYTIDPACVTSFVVQ